MSRAVLARIAAAPASPGPGVDGAHLQAALHRLLRQPAYARLRPGPIVRLETAVTALARRLLMGLWAAGRALLRQAAGLGRPGLALAGTAALVLGAWGIVVLLRRGFESRTRRSQAPSPAVTLVAHPDTLLAQGDTGGAVRAAYRQLLAAARQQGIDVRPGWTAARLLAAAPITQSWPGFTDFARFHDRVCFGPADAAPPSHAEVAYWLREVERWRRARPHHGADGWSASSHSPS